jgi:hypothetical protein
VNAVPELADVLVDHMRDVRGVHGDFDATRRSVLSAMGRSALFSAQAA